MKKPARHILALDTALNGCAVAVFDATRNKYTQEQREMIRGHSEEIMPMILRVLRDAEIEFTAIDLFAVTIGPGAFTGLRIGLATAQGLGLALDRPVIGVTTTQAVAQTYLACHSLEKNELLIVVLDTKRTDFYVQFCELEDHAHWHAEALSADEIADRVGERSAIFIGDGAERFLQQAGRAGLWRFAAGFARPDACMVARLANQIYTQATDDAKFLSPQPLYLRPPDVSMPKRALRTLAADGLRDA